MTPEDRARLRRRLELDRPAGPEDPGHEDLAREVAVTRQPDDPFAAWEAEYRGRARGSAHWHDTYSLDEMHRFAMTVRGRFYLESMAHDASLCKNCRLAILELIKIPPPFAGVLN